MNELNPANNIPASDSQEPVEEIEAEPTLNDTATSILKGLLYRRPPEFWGDWLEDALKAQPDIAEALFYLASAIDELAETIREQNHLRAKENPPSIK